MDISFMASAGEEGNWSLDECARWARENDFDCVRLADRGALDSQTIIDGGASSVRDTLSKHDVYLSCITAHHNLLDDDENEAKEGKMGSYEDAKRKAHVIKFKKYIKSLSKPQKIGLILTLCS